ncbi:TRAP transporter large permease [Castellaniella sp. GW247-6E4]|uniref:TRAP transporter large permease n=1 Tax=Castellaniella sp. GW247-6E4 TaxID=3140380 RepID=UPI003316389D
MDVTAVLIALGVLLVLIMIEIPLAISLAGAGIAGLVVASDASVATSSIGAILYSSTANFALIVIPLFILMGMYAEHGGMAKELFAVANKLFRGTAGSAGISAIAACAGFGAVCGSSLATAATIGRTTISELKRYGYSNKLAAGAIAAGGTLGILIPPSIILVLYGIITGEDIGALLIAGIIPGILSAIAYSITVSLLAGRDVQRTRTEQTRQIADTNRPTPTLPDLMVDSEQPTEMQMIFGAGRIAVLFIIIIGGIYTGLGTVSEVAALGALFALLFAVCVTIWRAGNPLEAFYSASIQAAKLSSSIMAIYVGASIFNYFLVFANVPSAAVQWVESLGLDPKLVTVAFLLMMIPLGMLLDSISIVVVTMPVIFPVINELGIDGVWFAILMVKLIEIGLLTPPVGLNCYVVAGTHPGLRSDEVFRGVMPFIATDLIVCAILFLVPSLVTWLPTTIAN